MVWPKLLVLLVIGTVMFAIALWRSHKVLH